VRRPRSSYSESREVGAAKLQAGGMELTLNDLIKWHADQAEAAIERARNAAENDIRAQEPHGGVPIPPRVCAFADRHPAPGGQAAPNRRMNAHPTAGHDDATGRNSFNTENVSFDHP
jgi:hypothetical protein